MVRTASWQPIAGALSRLPRRPAARAGMAMDCALVAYPLSAGFQARFEGLIGAPPEYSRVTELRRLPIRQMLRELASLAPHTLYLPLEDQSSAAILPVLQGLAALTRSRRIEIVDWELRRRRFSRWQLLGPACSLACASLSGGAQLRACRRELQRLLAQPRLDPATRPSRELLYINANLWFGLKAGGSIGHVAGVANALAGRGFDVTYAAAERAALLDPQLTQQVLSPLAHWGLPYEANLYRFHRRAVRELSGTLQRHWFHCIYQRMSVGNYTGVVLSRRSGTPLVLEYNGSEVWAQKNWGRPLRYDTLATWAETACLRHAHLVVTVSDVLRDELVDRGVEPQRVVSYPNCIDPRTFDPRRFSAADCRALRQRYQIADDAVVALFLGTFGQWHGVDCLARVIARLARDQADWLRSRKVHFLLVGDGLRMPVVRQELADPRCQPFYTLAGLVPQAEAAAHLAAADLLLSPHVPNADGSRFFGSPTKLFEYLAMGKGIVASALEQIGEVLAPGLAAGRLPAAAPDAAAQETAVLTRPGDEAELAEGIRFLVERADWRARLGENARRKALAEFTWDRHVEAILERLEQVAPAPAAGPAMRRAA